MRFTILFRDGARIDDEATERDDFAQILRLQQAITDRHTHLTVGLASGRVRTVGDIASIVIDGEG